MECELNFVNKIKEITEFRTDLNSNPYNIEFFINSTKHKYQESQYANSSNNDPDFEYTFREKPKGKKRGRKKSLESNLLAKKRTHEFNIEQYLIMSEKAKRNTNNKYAHQNKSTLIPQFMKTKEVNLVLPSYKSLTMTYKKQEIKFSVHSSYNNTKFFFNEIFIVKFSKKNELKKLNEYLEKHMNKTTRFFTFSIKSITSNPEDMFNLLSRLKVEGSFAYLENTIVRKEFMIMVDPSKLALNDLFVKLLAKEVPKPEFMILSIKEDIWRDIYQIEKTMNFGLFQIRNDMVKSGEKESRMFSEDFMSFHLHDAYKIELSSMNQVVYSYENNLLLEKINLKNKTNILEKVMNEKIDNINDEKSTLKNEIDLMEKKVNYYEKKTNFQIDIVDNCVIEVHPEMNENEKITESINNAKKPTFSIVKDSSQIEIHDKENSCPNIPTSANTPNKVSQINYSPIAEICIVCNSNKRDTAFKSCGHCLYCKECCNKFALNPVDNKTVKKKRRILKEEAILCPKCNVENEGYVTLLFN